MNTIGAAILAVFSAYGMMTLAHKICDWFLGRCGRCCVEIYVKGDTQNVEATVRGLVIKNPGAHIFVADDGSCGELHKILDKLCQDCENVHIDNS